MYVYIYIYREREREATSSSPIPRASSRSTLPAMMGRCAVYAMTWGLSGTFKFIGGRAIS